MNEIILQREEKIYQINSDSSHGFHKNLQISSGFCHSERSEESLEHLPSNQEFWQAGAVPCPSFCVEGHRPGVRNDMVSAVAVGWVER
jgi:hypothetical protein